MKIITGETENPQSEFVFNFMQEDNVTLNWALAAEYHLFSSFKRDPSQNSPTMVYSTISSPAIMLGKFQNAASVLKKDAWKNHTILRRITGGPAVFLNKGDVFITVLIPKYSKYLKSQSIRSIPKSLNDIVLSALRLEGLSLTLAASNVLTKRGYEVGGIGFEIKDDVVVWECWLGFENKISIPDEISNYPAMKEESFPRNPKPITEITDGVHFDNLGKALSETIPYNLKSVDIDKEDINWSWLEKERITGLMEKIKAYPIADIKNASYSHLVEDYIGFIQAAVTTSDDRILQDVKIYGDFLADSSAILELQEKLRWTPIKKRPIALTIDDILGSQSHVILGIKRLGSILEAIMDAATKTVEKTDS